MGNSPAYDLAYYIRNTIGKGSALGTDVMANNMPDSPDAVFVVYQYGGDASNRGMGADAGALENYRLQVDVRNLNAQTAETDCYAIYRAFEMLPGNVTINSVMYTWLHPLQPPFLLERDSQQRVTFIFNLEAQRIRP
jgi:hypothetical protein